MKKKEIGVQILGLDFVFNVPKEYNREDFLEIIRFVEDKMQSIKESASDLDPFRLSLLTTINVAEELFQLKRDNDQLRKVLGRIDHMISDSEGKSQNPIGISS